MGYEFDNSRPIYSQLIEVITAAIISGEYKPGDKLQPVREMATEFSVNPNTMQKALAELEGSGLLHTMRTTGRYITEDEDMIKTVKADYAKKKVEEFLLIMQSLGFTKEETLKIIEEEI